MNYISKFFILFIFSFSATLYLNAEDTKARKVEGVYAEGKTYITFKKSADFLGNYLVYRFAEIPKDLSGISPLAIIPNITFKHPDNNNAFYTPNGIQLTEEDGFFVNTIKEKGDFYYCILGEDSKELIVSGQNITEMKISEVPTEKHGALFQFQKKANEQIEDYYAFWMDYENWQKNNSSGQWPNKTNEYYGSFFSISYLEDQSNTVNMPVVVSLHAISGGGNGGYFALPVKKGNYRIYVSDHRKRWWGGSTMERVNYSIDYLINNPKYKIDLNRVYLEGTCMGGYGAIIYALQYPEKYAAIYAQVPRIDEEQLNNIKANMNLPPIITYFGFKDGDNSNYNFGKKGHAPFLKKMQENQFAIWSCWLDDGHIVPKDMNSEKCVFGGYWRFKKNEVVPVFLGNSLDQNCGQKGSINISPFGQVNQKINWSSSLCPFELENSKIIDSKDQLSMNFKSTENCITDLSFRRVQNFIVPAGKKLMYKNIDVLTNKELQAGEIVVPLEKNWVIKGLLMLQTGNKVLVRILPD
jgi:hypothetical protein